MEQARAKTSLSFKKSLLLGKYTVEFQAEFALPQFSLPLIVDALLKNVLSGMGNSDLVDVKGRDKKNLISEEIPSSMRPRGDELLFVHGVVFGGAAAARAGVDQGEPFALEITTPFKEFSGAHHIVHSIKERREGALPNFVPLSLIARAFPIRLMRFRLGIDFFSSSYISSFLGFVPTVKETLLIEADESKLLLRITAEDLKSKTSLPLERDSMLKRVNDSLRASAEINLIEAYNTEREKHG